MIGPAACRNERMYAWMIVAHLLEKFPAGAELADKMGQLPLHIAARNIGPKRSSRGKKLSPKEIQESQENAANSAEMVRALLEVYPDGARHKDMDGMLPLDWAVQNCSDGAYSVVQMLISVHQGVLVCQTLLCRRMKAVH